MALSSVACEVGGNPNEVAVVALKQVIILQFFSHFYISDLSCLFSPLPVNMHFDAFLLLSWLLTTARW